MFTGLVSATGRIVEREALAAGEARLLLRTPPGWTAGLAEGSSVAVAGVCLTALELRPDGFRAALSAETLARTTLGRLAPGAAVNLERALRLGDPLDGHLVTGHVDAVGEVLAVEREGGCQRWRFSLPSTIAPLVAVKGSIAVDGVSLTVNAVDGESFEVRLIPHTLAVTSFAERGPGDPVNLEADLIARHVARWLALRG